MLESEYNERKLELKRKINESLFVLKNKSGNNWDITDTGEYAVVPDKPATTRTVATCSSLKVFMTYMVGPFKDPDVLEWDEHLEMEVTHGDMIFYFDDQKIPMSDKDILQIPAGTKYQYEILSKNARMMFLFSKFPFRSGIITKKEVRKPVI